MSNYPFHKTVDVNTSLCKMSLEVTKYRTVVLDILWMRVRHVAPVATTHKQYEHQK